MSEIKHFGTPHAGSTPHSGRYAWGSGDDPYQRARGSLDVYDQLKKEGLTEAEIADAFGMESTVELRAKKSIAVNEVKAADIARAIRLKDHGNSTTEIGRIMGVPESTVRGWLKPREDKKEEQIFSTAAMLEKVVAEKGFIDVGKGVELELGISKDKLATAVQLCKEKGYYVTVIKVPQATVPGKYTEVKVLAPPGTTWSDINSNKGSIKSIVDYSRDDGKTWTTIQRPSSVDSKRIFVRYNETGGAEKDGTIEIRPGLADLTLGKSNYAQVRIAVDGTHYLKGMAFYSDNIPEGYDIIFNSNKHVGTPLKETDAEHAETVFKKLKSDPDNPFGALIKANGQTYYEDKNGEYVKVGESYVHKDKIAKKDTDGLLYSLSPINKIKEEGDWDHYSKNLSAQFLSKQNVGLIKQQLKLSYADKLDEFNDIENLTNPVIKQKLLMSFADSCDSAAVHLKASAVPGQSSKVILPIDSMADDQIYAPTYKNGTRVALIRYPHAGTFEIPILTVNNNQATAKKVIKPDSVDAVGINSKVAGILSGADFDGDSVVVIPVTDKVRITSSKQFEGLKEFNHLDQYAYYEGMKVISEDYKQKQMGVTTNLITDMTLLGATPSEIERAVKHSMVIIDAEKHKLNYRQSYKDNGIAALKKKYQPEGGASTIISRAKSPITINERKKSYKPDEETGKWVYTNTGRTYKKVIKDKETGKKIYTDEDVVATETIPKMSYYEDAMDLVSTKRHPKELIYAQYANQLKMMANDARKDAMAIKPYDVSTEARKLYSTEVASLEAKLKEAQKNAPKERQAQVMAAAEVKRALQIDPDLDKEHKTRIAQKALANARATVGAHKSDTQVQISDKEWEAIQARAISSSRLKSIIDNADEDAVKKLATPRSKNNTLPPAKVSRIKAMAASGFSLADIAEAVGVSPSTISNYVKD